MVSEQAKVVKVEIHTTKAKLQQALETRMDQLLMKAEEEEKEQLEALTQQQSKFELLLGNVTRGREFVEESHRLCSHGDILKVADPLAKQINHLTKHTGAEPLAGRGGLRFAHNPEEILALQAFGKVYRPPREIPSIR